MYAMLLECKYDFQTQVALQNGYRLDSRFDPLDLVIETWVGEGLGTPLAICIDLFSDFAFTSSSTTPYLSENLRKVRKRRAMIFSLWLCLLGVLSAQAVRVWPQPSFISQGHDALWVSRESGLEARLHCKLNGTEVREILSSDTVSGLLKNSFSQWLGYHPGLQETGDELSEELILRDAVGRSDQAIRKTHFVPWKTHPRHSNFEPSSATDDKETAVLKQLRITQVHCPLKTKLDPEVFFAGDESYELIIEQGTATINSNSTLGTIRALQTFEQLFYAHSNHSDVYIPDTPLRLSDKPRWMHRGLLIDIARNVFKPEDVLRTMDAMASIKLSRLHIHATDSQSWPIEIPALPDLASKGTYHPNQIWTQGELRRIQRYGIARGISVFLEIDMPGHTASIAHAYPELIAAFNEPDWSTFAAEPLSGQLKLDSPAVYHFVDKLFVSIIFFMILCSSRVIATVGNFDVRKSCKIQ